MSVVAGTVLGATGIALGTAAGRNVLVGTALGIANNALDGHLTIGSVSGSLRHGLEARDVVLVGSDSTPFARVPSLSVRYRLRDLLSRRIVLGQVTLDHPVVDVTQFPDGRFNYQRIFRIGGPPGGGSPPFIALQDVEIDSGSVVIRTRAGKGDTTRFEYVPEMDGGHRVRRITSLTARLSYLRLSSPLPGERAIVADIASLRARISDPAVVIRAATGHAEIEGDSIRINLPRLAAGSSTLTLDGTVSWPSDTLLFDLAAETRDATVDDIRPLVPRIPRGLEATGTFLVKSLAGDILLIDAEKLTLTGRRGGGTAVGRAGMVLGPRAAWSSRKTDLVLDNLDLEYVRPFLDTLPIAGRLTGTVTADGPDDHLAVTADVTFRDSLVSGWPVSTGRVAGVLTVAQPEGVTFQDFQVMQAAIDLRTVKRLLPATVLQGFIAADGTLNGPWLEASFDGELRHSDAPLPETVARGTIQIDARGDTLGVWANLAFDSLRLPGLWSSFPGLRAFGTFAGDVRVGGYVDSLALTAALTGPPGAITGSTSLTLISPHNAAHGLDFQFRSLDVRGLFVSPVATSLNGRITGGWDVDTLRPSTSDFAVRLDTSRVGGTLMDSAHGSFRAADGLFRVDSASAWALGTVLEARGALALAAPRRDSIGVRLVLDSAGALEPLLSGLLELADDTLRRPLSGVVTAEAGVTGSLDAFEIAASVHAPGVRWGAFTIAGAEGRGLWSSSGSGSARFMADVASLEYGSLRFDSLAASFSGRRDSVTWTLRGRGGDEASMALSGGAVLDSAATHLAIDSARLVLPGGTWTLGRRALIVVRDSAVDLDTLVLSSANDTARVEFVGSVPLNGHGRLTVTLEALPLKDLFALLQMDTRPVAGTVAGTIDLAGTARAPQMAALLTATAASYGDFRMATIEADLDYAARRLQGEFTLRSATAVPLQVTADIPVDLALRGAAASRTIPGDLSIRAQADSADLAILEAILPAVRSASGRLDGDFGIVGSWEQPRLSGSLQIRNGAATYPGIGARHEGVNGRLTMNGDTLRIEGFTLRSGSSGAKTTAGALEVNGTLRLERLTHPVVNVHLVARDFFTMDVRNFVTATASGDFQLSGPLIGARFSGAGTIPRGTLHYTDLVYKRILNLEDTLFRGMIDTMLIRRQGLGRAFENRFFDSLFVDSLRLTLGSEVWLRSTEANIQLAGDVIFSKAADEYRAEGTLDTPRGTYQLPLGTQFTTRDFSVTRGQVRMLGTPDLNALVDIDGQHVVRRRVGDNVNVFVHIGGTLYEPVLTLSSDIRPPVPESEIVAYLLFGRPLNTNEATAAGGRALVQGALSALAGQVENSLLSNLGSPITPDYFQISPGEKLVGTQAEFGWLITPFGVPAFVTPSIRFGCRSAATAGNWGVSLEFKLSKDWRVAGSVEPTRGCNTTGVAGSGNRQLGVDVFWEMNY